MDTGGKATGSEARSSTEVKSTWIFTSTPPTASYLHLYSPTKLKCRYDATGSSLLP